MSTQILKKLVFKSNVLIKHRLTKVALIFFVSIKTINLTNDVHNLFTIVSSMNLIIVNHINDLFTKPTQKIKTTNMKKITSKKIDG